jgi:serine protease AprX
MRRLITAMALFVGLYAFPIARPVSATTAAYLDPLLTAALATAPATSSLMAVAAFSHAPTSLDLAAVRATGVVAVPYSRLPMAAIEGTPVQISALAAVSGVSSLWLNHGLELALHESVPLIQADKVWAPPLGFNGQGVGVAVLDSGIDGNHPDVHFPEHTKQNVKLLGDQHVFSDLTFAVENVPDTDTTTGHGTHVAGIVAGDGTASSGYYKGVAPGADLIGVGAADGLDMLTALAGYDWIIGHKDALHIRVINNSWADDAIAYDPNDPLNQASLAAHNAGITVVFAAGNDGQTGANVFNRYAWPSWVVSTGGGDKLGALGSYSSGGDDTNHPTVISPGSFIASARAITGVVTDLNSTPLDLTDPSNPRVVPAQWDAYYTVALGTSMAAPHLSGVVALMVQANPALTPDQVKSIVASTATPVPGCAVANCGAGYVNALAAVQAAVASRNQPPVAALAVSPSSGAAPLSVTLDASGSTDANGVASYRWDFQGDGSVDAVTSTPVVVHSYAAGAYAPTVVALDTTGLASLPAGASVRAADPPHAVVSAPKKAKAGTAVAIDASASSDPAHSVLTYTFTFGDGATLVSNSPVASHVYTTVKAALFAWSVKVTNAVGVSDAAGGTIKITP